MSTEFLFEEAAPASLCHHHESESRIKIDSLGRPQIVLQCVDCGKRMSKDISAESFSAAQLDSMPKWDLELQRKFHGFTQVSWYEQQESGEVLQKLKNHEEYLLSQKWKEIRERVMARSKMVCEGCGVKPAVMVHHLTFKRFGDEMLFDLVAICDECRVKLHAGLGASERAPEPKV